MFNDIQITYDHEQRGFVASMLFQDEVRADALPEYGGKVTQAAMDFGKKLLDSHSFLTIPNRLRVYVRAPQVGQLLLYCRLPLADTDEMLDARQMELDAALEALQVASSSLPVR